jgi:hypothetical protein
MITRNFTIVGKNMSHPFDKIGWCKIGHTNAKVPIEILNKWDINKISWDKY